MKTISQSSQKPSLTPNSVKYFSPWRSKESSGFHRSSYNSKPYQWGDSPGAHWCVKSNTNISFPITIHLIPLWRLGSRLINSLFTRLWAQIKLCAYQSLARFSQLFRVWQSLLQTCESPFVPPVQSYFPRLMCAQLVGVCPHLISTVPQREHFLVELPAMLRISQIETNTRPFGMSPLGQALGG